MELMLMKLTDIARLVEAYDPSASPDNRADELALHQHIVMVTGVGTLTPAFEDTFVRSLDAAMTLVPGGWDWAAGTAGEATGGHAYLRCVSNGKTEIETDAATPALALTAAALRAHATRGPSDGTA